MPVPPGRRQRTPATRADLVNRVGAYLEADNYQCFGMVVIVSTAGLAGFLVSAFPTANSIGDSFGTP